MAEDCDVPGESSVDRDDVLQAAAMAAVFLPGTCGGTSRLLKKCFRIEKLLASAICQVGLTQNAGRPWLPAGSSALSNPHTKDTCTVWMAHRFRSKYSPAP